MKILLDTHIAIWAVTDSQLLSVKAKSMLEDENNEVFYSVASIWETVLKHSLHPNQIPVDGDELESFCERTGFRVLPILSRHAVTVKTLHLRDGAPPHKDPFDKILLAQAKADGLKFMTHDEKIPYYDENFIISV